MVTGGTSNTRTPMLKFLMNEELEPASDARHIEHCPNAELASTSTIAIAANTPQREMFPKLPRIDISVPLRPQPVVAALP